jgi:hypothetical protein
VVRRIQEYRDVPRRKAYYQYYSVVCDPILPRITPTPILLGIQKPEFIMVVRVPILFGSAFQP